MYEDCEVVKLRKGNVAYLRDGELVAKTCTRCGSLKGVTEYFGDKKKKFGKQAHCKVCDVAKARNWKINNANKSLANSVEYYERNKEKRKASTRKWKDNNRDKLVVYSRRYKARKVSLPGTLTVAQTECIMERFGGCALSGSSDIHLDHVIPLNTGHGGTVVGNMVPLRGDLNISKNAKNVFVWFNSVREREHLEQERFNAMITYLAEKNGMTVFEYTAYVYECHTKEE